MEPALQDQFFLITGVETSELDVATETHRLVEDEEYMKILTEF